MPVPLSRQTTTNLPARLRMAATYAVAQSVNGRVANTCNLSEDWVGYSTRYGDAAGDFSPLSHLTVQEVRAIGTELGLPDKLVYKVPVDGLSGLTDEENLGFTYAVLDNYIRTGVCEDLTVKAEIDRKRRNEQIQAAADAILPLRRTGEGGRLLKRQCYPPLSGSRPQLKQRVLLNFLNAKTSAVRDLRTACRSFPVFIIRTCLSAHTA